MTDHSAPPSVHSPRADATPTLVLLHAFPFDRAMWQPQRDGLGGKARVIALDLPGFGEAPARPGAFTIDSAADAVAEALTAQGVSGRVVLGGLSMGGYVALAYARRHPDRLAGLILADTRSEPDDATARQGRDKMIAVATAAGTAGVVEQLLPRLLGEATRAERPQTVALVRQIAGRQPAAAVAAALAAMRDRPDATPGLAAVAVPTLILVGEHDAVTPPAAAKAMGERIRNSRVVVIPGAGHMSNLEAPETFNAEVISFLSTICVTDGDQ